MDDAFAGCCFCLLPAIRALIIKNRWYGNNNFRSTGFLGEVLLKKALLTCGILSSLLYVGADILAAMRKVTDTLLKASAN
jgi:hypothetical protein